MGARWERKGVQGAGMCENAHACTGAPACWGGALGLMVERGRVSSVAALASIEQQWRAAREEIRGQSARLAGSGRGVRGSDRAGARVAAGEGVRQGNHTEEGGEGAH